EIAHSVGERVQFAGHKTRAEVEKLYGQSAVVVMPSVWPEAFGKIGIEAMSVGRPVVAANVGGIAEWMAPEVGFLVPSKDSAAIAQSINALFSDSALREKMSRAAPEHAKKYSLENHLQQMLELYEALARR